MIKEKKRRTELSERELAVLEYLAKGWADADIATELSMSLVGVRGVIRRACQKTASTTRCSLITWAFKNKVL